MNLTIHRVQNVFPKVFGSRAYRDSVPRSDEYTSKNVKKWDKQHIKKDVIVSLAARRVHTGIVKPPQLFLA